MMKTGLGAVVMVNYRQPIKWGLANWELLSSISKDLWVHCFSRLSFLNLPWLHSFLSYWNSWEYARRWDSRCKWLLGGGMEWDALCSDGRLSLFHISAKGWRLCWEPVAWITREIKVWWETECLQRSSGPSQHRERGSCLRWEGCIQALPGSYQRLSGWTTSEGRPSF